MSRELEAAAGPQLQGATREEPRIEPVDALVAELHGDLLRIREPREDRYTYFAGHEIKTAAAQAVVLVDLGLLHHGQDDAAAEGRVEVAYVQLEVGCGVAQICLLEAQQDALADRLLPAAAEDLVRSSARRLVAISLGEGPGVGIVVAAGGGGEKVPLCAQRQALDAQGRCGAIDELVEGEGGLPAVVGVVVEDQVVLVVEGLADIEGGAMQQGAALLLAQLNGVCCGWQEPEAATEDCQRRRRRSRGSPRAARSH